MSDARIERLRDELQSGDLTRHIFLSVGTRRGEAVVGPEGTGGRDGAPPSLERVHDERSLGGRPIVEPARADEPMPGVARSTP